MPQLVAGDGRETQNSTRQVALLGYLLNHCELDTGGDSKQLSDWQGGLPVIRPAGNCKGVDEI